MCSFMLKIVRNMIVYLFFDDVIEVLFILKKCKVFSKFRVLKVLM